MKYLLILLAIALVSCGEKAPKYRCEQMDLGNKVEGCKLGDWYNFDLKKCNSTLENCLKD